MQVRAMADASTCDGGCKYVRLRRLLLLKTVVFSLCKTIVLRFPVVVFLLKICCNCYLFPPLRGTPKLYTEYSVLSKYFYVQQIIYGHSDSFVYEEHQYCKVVFALIRSVADVLLPAFCLFTRRPQVI